MSIPQEQIRRAKMRSEHAWHKPAPVPPSFETGKTSWVALLALLRKSRWSAL